MKTNFKKTAIIIVVFAAIFLVAYRGYSILQDNKIQQQNEITDVFYGAVVSVPSKNDQGQSFIVKVMKSSFYPQIGSAQGKVVVYDPNNIYIPPKNSPWPNYIFSTVYDLKKNQYILINIKGETYHPTGDQ